MARWNLTLEERFWSKVHKTDNCWLWTAHKGIHGYGYFHIKATATKSRTSFAHRVSWSLANGRPIPQGLDVLHKCDNPPCVNPDHLFLGTETDNLQDASRKGRTCRGERRKNHKLTEDGVRRMRDLRAEGWTEYALMAEFGVSRGVVIRVTKRKAWRHVT